MDQLRQKKGFICDMDGVGDIPGPAEQEKNKQSASGFCRKRIAYCDIFKGVTPV